MANGNSAPSSRFVSIGQASEVLGVSRQALRLYEQQGKITSYRTCGGAGHRRYRLSELQEQVLGVDPDEISAERKIALYCRVSHSTQKAHLETQRQRLIAEVCEREKCNESDLLIFQEVASSFGNRPALNKLIDSVCENKISTIYAEHHDRLSRVASLTRLVEHLCSKHRVRIVALDREQDQDDMQQNMSELIEFVHVISCRTIARRTAERKKKKVPPVAIEFIQKQIGEGRSIRDTTRLLENRGYRTTDGKTISYRVVHNYYKSIKLTSSAEEKDTFAEFVGECLTKKKGKRVQSTAIYEAYRQWCNERGLQPIHKRRCSDWLIANKYRREIQSGYTWYVNIDLPRFKTVLNGKGKYARQ